MEQLRQLANAIRMLSIDAVNQAQSGHPGMPLGMADVAAVLWHKFLKHNPKNPQWFNRDRFILSNGHGSMLLYALLHLTGYPLTLTDLKNFRQLHAKTPGHPEYGHTPGVETTTGPLGQGLANAVGFALAEKLLSTQYNQPSLNLVDHHTYAIVGDGCLMEGISHEVCALAGTLKLGKLIVFYDSNGISIDGVVSSWFNDDTPARFRAYHWQVIGPIDGHDPCAIEQAILQAQTDLSQPSLIICNTIIGLGATVAGTEQAHGAPLSQEDMARVRDYFDWNHPAFEIPQTLYDQWNHLQQGQLCEQQWLMCLNEYQQQHPTQYSEFLRRINGDLPDSWPQDVANFLTQCRHEDKAMATRKASQYCIEFFASKLPELFGGSADLTHSNNTNWSGSIAIHGEQFLGNYLHYGVREFGMSGIMNGMSLHGGFIPYGGTFLVFTDYMRAGMRLSALMNQRVIYILTHDSIGLGEDGPTHQPIEHASMLRTTPNMTVWRPADLVETAIAWSQAIAQHHGPSALLLSRQNLPPLKQTDEHIGLIHKGGYIIRDCEAVPDAIFIATGSEVHLALEAARKLESEGLHIRVVSMPCCEYFKAQPLEYQESVLPANVPIRIAVEAGSTAYWYQFVGLNGAVIGVDRFGSSAPGAEVFQYLGITVQAIINTLKQCLGDFKAEKQYDHTHCH